MRNPDFRAQFVRISTLVTISLAAFLLISCGADDSAPTTSQLSTPTPMPTETETPKADLVIESVQVDVPPPEVCDDWEARVGVIVTINNQGEAASGPFAVRLNQRTRYVISGVRAAESIQLRFPLVEEQLAVYLDASEKVIEKDEQNNQFEQLVARPTIPAQCVRVPTPVVADLDPLAELAGHTGKVWHADFSPVSNILASGSVDNTMRLWLVDEAVLLRTMYGHPFPITTLAFSPDGGSLATGSSDGLIRLWRVSDGRLIRTLSGHAGWILDLEFSQDGKRLASTAQDFTVRLWRVGDGKLMTTIDEGLSSVYRVTFSPDSSQLSWAEENGMIRIWDVDQDGWLAVIQGPRSARSVAFSPDGSALAVGYSSGSIRLWDLVNGTESGLLTGHLAPVTDLAFTPGGEWLVSGSLDQTVRIWRMQPDEGSDLPEIYILTGHKGPVNSVAISPDGEVIASASDDDTILLWSVPEN